MRAFVWAISFILSADTGIDLQRVERWRKGERSWMTYIIIFIFNLVDIDFIDRVVSVLFGLKNREKWGSDAHHKLGEF
jgi:hypothetical protein